MKTKTTFFLFAFIAAAAVTFGFDVMHNNGEAGRTGSPGESTCNIMCHTGSSLNDGTGSVTISSPDLIGWQYMPGDTYTININVARVGNSLFGFGVECLTMVATPQNAGTLIITNTTETQFKFATVMTVSRRNVVHKLNGGIGTNSKTFSFKWKAPATNIGNVTFYVAGNAANGNNTTSGDHIYTTTQLVVPDPTAGISAGEGALNSFSVFPNPASNFVTLSYNAPAGAQVVAELISPEGKNAGVIYSATGDDQQHEVTIDLPENLATGIYSLRLTDGNNAAVRRLVIE
ncbi:MAG TPA: choice-of-anchor V domain-containing protein [Bacteroidia bacterium]|nr:choice-of-anchor V domain-containing protein [Bacteroidia bacterium]